MLGPPTRRRRNPQHLFSQQNTGYVDPLASSSTPPPNPVSPPSSTAWRSAGGSPSSTISFWWARVQLFLRQHLPLLALKRINTSQVILSAWNKLDQTGRSLVVAIAVLLLCRCIFQIHQMFTTIHGGVLGRFAEERILRPWSLSRYYQRRQQELKAIGVELPQLKIRNEPNVFADPSPFGYVALSLSKSIRDRHRLWKGTERKITNYLSNRCSSSESSKEGLPQWVLKPNFGVWYSPMTFCDTRNNEPKCIKEMDVLEFDEDLMEHTVVEYCPDVVELYMQDRSTSDASQLRTFHLSMLCSLYWYGGHVLFDPVRSSYDLLYDLSQQQQSRCVKNYAIAAVSRQAPQIPGQESKLGTPLSVGLIAATPKNPTVYCLLHEYARREAAVPSQTSLADLLSEIMTSDPQTPLTIAIENMSFCQNFHFPASLSTKESELLIRVIDKDTPEYQQPTVGSISITDSKLDGTKLNYPIRQDPGLSFGVTPGYGHCNFSWICRRCLGTPLFGTLRSCWLVCSDCRGQHPEIEKPKQRATEVQVNIIQNQSSRLIPRLIHQAWDHDILTIRFPELARLQNIWTEIPNYEYRYYNADETREYVANVYPKQVLAAFDAIRTQTGKRDLFKLLVLLREGGIYLDIDVLLEVSHLDAFILPHFGFFAARLGDDADGPSNCLYNGIIGAAPGHPFVVQAVESIVNTIMQRSKYEDIEARVLGEDKEAEMWRLYASPSARQLITGSCALGRAVNNVLRRPPLTSFEPGFVVHPSDSGLNGETLILLSDNDDMGAYRISDLGRYLMVASTKLLGLLMNSVLIADAEKHLRIEKARDSRGFDSVANDVYMNNIPSETFIRITCKNV